MPTMKQVPVTDLHLDLHNYRTMPQANEVKALHALAVIGPDRFWGLCTSLLDKGFLLNEPTVVVRQKSGCVVKEGNRRVAATKLILGLLPATGLSMPKAIHTRIGALGKTDLAQFETVPCVVYPASEAAEADRIVSLTHGLAEAAARLDWESIARTRNNRDMNGSDEPVLDLVETYFRDGQNITQQQKEVWAGIYSLTVLEEAIAKSFVRFGATSPRHLATIYPTQVAHREALERLMHDIGENIFGFKHLRDSGDPFLEYGLPTVLVGKPGTQIPGTQTPPSVTPTGGGTTGGRGAPGGAPGGSKGGGGPSPPPVNGRGGKAPAIAVHDARSVRRRLKHFKPVGNDRNKVETLRQEMVKLSVEDHPHAFCFVLRSMFELSGKAYASDHKIPLRHPPKPNPAGGPTKPPKDKTLAELLSEVCQHIVTSSGDPNMTKVLHGARTEISSPNGFLSVVSMNQLVHNPHFSATEKHICTVFHNVYPLLEAMNS